jgi:hypothetical protein
MTQVFTPHLLDVSINMVQVILAASEDMASGAARGNGFPFNQIWHVDSHSAEINKPLKLTVVAGRDMYRDQLMQPSDNKISTLQFIITYFGGVSYVA